jgi:hypothetical protein
MDYDPSNGNERQALMTRNSDHCPLSAVSCSGEVQIQKSMQSPQKGSQQPASERESLHCLTRKTMKQHPLQASSSSSSPRHSYCRPPFSMKTTSLLPNSPRQWLTVSSQQRYHRDPRADVHQSVLQRPHVDCWVPSLPNPLFDLQPR